MALLDPNREELQALARLHHVDDFRLFIRWLSRCLAQARERNDGMENEVHLRRGQGAAIMLKEILEHEARAEEAIRELINQEHLNSQGS